MIIGTLALIICIKIFLNTNFINIFTGSECYPCICEILDFWWPDDAPNCFKKEIQKITKNEEIVLDTENTVKSEL